MKNDWGREGEERRGKMDDGELEKRANFKLI